MLAFSKILKWRKIIIGLIFRFVLNARQVHSDLKSKGEDAPTIQLIHNWFKLFKKGKTNLSKAKKWKDRVRICKNLEKIKCKVTYDECWFYHRHIGKRKSTQSWVDNLKQQGKSLYVILEKGVSINFKIFKSNCLFPLIVGKGNYISFYDMYNKFKTHVEN